MNKIVVVIIKIYKKIISPYLPKACRFYPTCADYSIAAFEKYGLLNGCYKSIIRLCKCNPLFHGGYDPLK